MVGTFTREEIVPPIIADGDGETAAYESIDRAEAAWEFYEDVVEEVTFFDSTGRLLKVEPGERKYSYRLAPTDIVDADRARAALIRYLRLLGEPIGDAAPLDWLIERRIDRERHPRPLFNFWPFRRRADRSG